jgi:protein-S-isoprenylcysteine O-methyltransferase Ste14
MWAAIYLVLTLALFVRFQDPAAPVRAVRAAAPGEPLRLVGVHHALFYLLVVLACPLEALLTGGAAAGRLAGAIAFASGIALYRWGAAWLGDAVSPFVTPHPDGRLVTGGPYRLVRHPMYLGQLLIAFGAPATLGCRVAFALSFAAAIVLVIRMRLEEDALARTYVDFGGYRARSKRLLPFIF